MQTHKGLLALGMDGWIVSPACTPTKNMEIVGPGCLDT